MENNEEAKKLEKSMDDLAKRMVGKTQEEQARMLADFAKEQYGTEMPEKQPNIQLTDDQFRMLMTGGEEGVQKVVKDAKEGIERKFNVPAGAAHELAQDTVQKELKRQAVMEEDFKIAAQVFRTIAHAAQGRATGAELRSAYEMERDHLVRTGRQIRGNSLDAGTGADGGYLAPEIWNTYLYENLARVSLMRRFAYWFPMQSNIMRLPKITAGLTGVTLSEGTAASTGYKPSISQATWEIKKLTALTAPFSIELLESAVPELVQLLTLFATVELNRKEDEVCFNTSDSAWSDLLDSSTNVVQMATGKTKDTDADFDDMTSLIYKLAEQYVPDDDVQGSGLISGQAQFWVNKNLIQNLLGLKGSIQNYLWGPVDQLAEQKNIRGYRVRRVLSMPSSATASTKFAAFGNLNYRWVGYKPGFIIDFLREGTVKDAAGADVNLALTSQYALRVNELLDVQTIDDNAFSELETAAS